MDTLIAASRPPTSRSEYVRLGIIFSFLLAIVSIPALFWIRYENRRPALLEVRVVSATSTDPVFRQGPRTVESGENVRLAVALYLHFPGRGDIWHAPVDRLELIEGDTDHVKTFDWPEPDRSTRVFWFTLEGPYLGGDLSADDLEGKLSYRSFLAPELGHAWTADGEPESHADDGVNLGPNRAPIEVGTYRPYARVHVTEKSGTTHPIFAQTSLGAADLDHPAAVRISRRLGPQMGLHAEAGELFRLPGFEPSQDHPPDLEGLCRRRMATSSETFAATAVTGQPTMDGVTLEKRLSFTWTDQGPTGLPRPMKWDSDLAPLDLLRRGRHWLVLVGDDGDGVFGGEDLVATCWRRPPSVLPIGSALESSEQEIELLRRSETSH